MQGREIVGTSTYDVPLRGSPGARFTQALKVPTTGSLLFISGITARNSSGEIIVGDVASQVRRVLSTIEAILDEAGGTLEDIVKITTYLRDIDDLPTVARIRREYFGQVMPASTSVQVSGLADPRQLIEIDAVAMLTS